MKNLQGSFQRLLVLYESHKLAIKKHIHKLKDTGYNIDAVACEALYDKVTMLIKELTVLFEQQPDANFGVVKIQLKLLRKTLKELIELKKPWWRQFAEAIIITGAIVFFLKTYVFGTYYVPTGSAEPTILIGDRLWVNKLIYHYQGISRGDYVVLDDPKFVPDKNPFQAIWQKYIGCAIPLLGLKDGAIPFTKRIIAIPGDTIEGREEGGQAVVYLNGVKLEEPYINSHPLIYMKRTSGFFDLGPLACIPILNWLQYKVHPIMPYTFDPLKDLQHQPWYYFTASEIYLDHRTQEPLFKGVGYAEDIDVFGPIKLRAGQFWGMGDSRKNSGDSRCFGIIDKSMIYGRASFVMYSIDSVEAFWPFALLKNPIEFFRYRVRWNRFFKVFKHQYEEEQKEDHSEEEHRLALEEELAKKIV
ncbi:MAG: signal peptidase I [Paludibacter sp.]